jgi:hypothetical protein
MPEMNQFNSDSTHELVEHCSGIAVYPMWNSCEFQFKSGIMYALISLNTILWNA